MSSRLRIFGGFALLLVWSGVSLAAPFAYITNLDSNSVSVIDVFSNNVVATIPVGSQPAGVAVNSTGARIYVANVNSVSVIDGASKSVIATMPVGVALFGIAVNPDGTRVYVADQGSDSVAVINTSSNTVVTTAAVGAAPGGIVVNPQGTRVYVTNTGSDSVSVIDTATNKEIEKIQVAAQPAFAAINPAGTRLYVTHYVDNPNDPLAVGLSVIDTASNTKIAGIALGLNNGEGVAVNPAGTLVYVTAVQGGVVVIDANTNAVLDVLPAAGRLAGISLDPAGTRIYAADSVDNQVIAIDVNSGAVIKRVDVGLFPTAFGQFIMPTPPSAGGATVIEYHHAGFDHYFITPVAAEIALLDAHTPPFQDWSRTGFSFNAYALAGAPADSVAICRFFNDHFAPKSSHFYAPLGFGCEATLAQFPDWTLEDDKLFKVMLPDAAVGSCPARTIPVYRLYNNGMGNAPNHRFVTSSTERQNMINQGWTAEGAGIGVGMCVPE